LYFLFHFQRPAVESDDNDVDVGAPTHNDGDTGNITTDDQEEGNGSSITRNLNSDSSESSDDEFPVSDPDYQGDYIVLYRISTR
jgi:hypothetical protein